MMGSLLALNSHWHLNKLVRLVYRRVVLTIATLWLLLSLLEWAQEAGLVLETYVLLVWKHLHSLQTSCTSHSHRRSFILWLFLMYADAARHPTKRLVWFFELDSGFEHTLVYDIDSSVARAPRWLQAVERLSHIDSLEGFSWAQCRRGQFFRLSMLRWEKALMKGRCCRQSCNFLLFFDLLTP